MLISICYRLVVGSRCLVAFLRTRRLILRWWLQAPGAWQTLREGGGAFRRAHGRSFGALKAHGALEIAAFSCF